MPCLDKKKRSFISFFYENEPRYFRLGSMKPCRLSLFDTIVSCRRQKEAVMSRWNTPKENDPYPFTPMRTTANFLFLSPLASQHSTFIADVWPHARTRGGRGCRPHGLDYTNSVSPNMSTVSGSLDALSSNIPGPLTFRMMERVWSSMNSTRTWVTPPREPVQGFLLAFSVYFLQSAP